MRKFFTILAVAMLAVSCHQEYDIPLPQKERDVLPAPTRLERNPSLFLNDSLMVLGLQLENPYALDVMQEARAQLLEENPGMSIPAITAPSHYYVRFAPANDDELYTLLQDTTVHFFDFPLDREVVSGVYYHDPAIADSLPTYQYASIPVEKWLRDYSDSAISHEILEDLFIPEDEEDFFGGGGDDDGDGNWWDNGNITPSIPENPWIPSLPGDGEINPNTVTLSAEDIIDMLVDKAMYLTGNLDSDSDTSTQSVAGTNSSNGRWTPSGRITTYDNLAATQIPLEGVKVLARRWFTTYTGFTDANGYFTCDGSFKKPANYCIKWERAYWDIREGWFGQAYYNGPKLQSEWNLNIGSEGGKSLRYATIHRAAHRFFYKNDTLAKPRGLSKVKIAYQHRAADEDGVEGRYWLEFGLGIFPDIQIFGFNDNTSLNTQHIFTNTSHELGHAAHWTNSTINFADAGITGDLNFIESWARCVEYVMTTIEYKKLGVIDRLNEPWYIYTNGNLTKRYLPNGFNNQYWILPDSSDSIGAIYTPIFIDLIDDFNQKDYGYNLPNGIQQWQIALYPNDTLCYPLTLIESLVFDSASLNGVRNKLTAKLNPLTDGNIQEKYDAIMSFFEQYQH